MTPGSTGKPHSSSGRELVVIRAGSSWDGTRLADRHVASRLAERCNVIYVDPPLSFRSAKNDARLASAAAEPEFRQAGTSLWRLTPRVPPRRRYPVVRDISDRLVARAARKAVAQLGRGTPRAVLSVSDDMLGVLPGRQVHWARDDYAAGSSLMNVPESLLERREKRIRERSDSAIAVTDALVAKWEGFGIPTTLVPNGVDAAAFGSAGPRPADVPDPGDGPLVGFCGTISARIDLGLVEAVADSGLTIMLLGAPQHTLPRAEFDRLLSRPGVHWMGNRVYEEVPAYIAAMDVGLVPYTDTAFNRASFPLKTLEYLACGVPVVASELPAIRQLDTDLVQVGDAGDFADLVADQGRLRHEPDLVRRRKEFAARHSWDERTDRIAEALGI